MDTVEIILYFVGETEDEAREGMYFDDEEFAKQHAHENGGEIFEAIATIDFTTLTKTV